AFVGKEDFGPTAGVWTITAGPLQRSKDERSECCSAGAMLANLEALDK
ncbi:MAG: hypothetical protein JWN53_1110, partial [Gemmatimonadetes bacterium]|nr:hypothetical protein [Gemmatimonadota bacterium]